MNRCILLSKALLISLAATTLVAYGHNKSVDNFYRRVVFLNDTYVPGRNTNKCIGILSADNTIKTSQYCISLMSSLDNVTVVGVNNTEIGRFALTNISEDLSHAREESLNISGTHHFYIYSKDEQRKWIPVTVSEAGNDLYQFSYLANEEASAESGAPIINDNGELLCMNNGNGYCEYPSVLVGLERPVSGKNCSLPQNTFHCLNATWNICSAAAEVGMGYCYRSYDQAKCNITILGDSYDSRGTISCQGCNADWQNEGGKLTQKSDTPSGCMSHPVSDWRTPLIIGGSLVGAASLLTVSLTGCYMACRKTRTGQYKNL